MMKAMEMNEFSLESPAAVKVRNARKAYGSNVILNGMNMAVPEGAIYGLLGPSGCGKTTLINCLVGQMRLDSGSIEMSMTKQSDIGYMPQTVSLHESLTAYENISFFGFLIGMSNRDIRAKVDELTTQITIPPTDRLVCTLSGGQQRCVSLMIAFLHDPKLLILDEPTVGMDSLLSQCIWNHLLRLAEAGKSIIITTHYIEEAKRAHVVGLLRGGGLLAEDAPLSLIERHGCQNLEEAFLKLCSAEIETKTRRNRSVGQILGRRQTRAQVSFNDRPLFSFKRFRALMYKNVLLRRRTIGFELLMLVLPLIQITLCSLCVGVKPKDLKIAVVNDESTCERRSYEHACFSDANATNILSCLYLDELRHLSYDLITYADLDKSLKEVFEKKEDTWALLHFNRNYSKMLVRRMQDSLDMTDEEITDSISEAWVDYSDPYIGSYIREDVSKSLLPILQKARANCNLSVKFARPLLGVSLQPPIYGSQNTEFQVYSIVSLVCLASMFAPSFSVAVYSQGDRISGMMERMFVSGASVAEILLSMGLTQFAVHAFQTPLNLILTFVIFSHPLSGSLTDFATFQILIGSMGALHGIFMSLISDQVMFMGVMQIGFHMMLSLTTGLFWPVEAAHGIIRFLNQYFLPLSDAVVAARDIALRNYSMSDSTVLQGYISTLVWHLVFVLQISAVVMIKKNLFLGKVVRN